MSVGFNECYTFGLFFAVSIKHIHITAFGNIILCDITTNEYCSTCYKYLFHICIPRQIKFCELFVFILSHENQFYKDRRNGLNRYAH